MKLSDAKLYLSFIQAAAEGKTVQQKYGLGPLWKDEGPDFEFDRVSPKYLRIKPTPKLRPWKPEEVPVGALIKYDDTVAVISFATSQKFGFVKVYDGTDDLDVRQWKLDMVFDTILHSTDHGKTWLPCGVMEES